MSFYSPNWAYLSALQNTGENAFKAMTSQYLVGGTFCP